MVLNTEWAQVEVIDLINDGSGLAFGIIGGRSTGVVVKTIVPGGVADRDGRLQSGDHILQIGEVNLRGLGSEQVASVLRQCGVHVRMIVARPIESTSLDIQSLVSHAPVVPTKILGDPVELDKHLIENGFGDIFSTLPPSNNFSTPYIFTGQQTDFQLHSIPRLNDYRTSTNGTVLSVSPNLSLTSSKIPPALDIDLQKQTSPETEMYTVKLCKDDLGLGITVAGYVCEKEEISGIFVKSISQGSAADINGKIKINDRIVEVDGASVVGQTNHQAVEILRNTGPIVTITLERYLRGPKYEQLQQAIRANELKPPSPPSPSISSLPKIPLSLVNSSIEPDGESRTSFDFDSAILLDFATPTNEQQEIVIDGRKSVQFSICSQDSINDKWKEKLEEDAEIVIAEMTKDDNSGLGISLEGTVDVEGGQEVRPHHYIRNILPNGPVGKHGVLQSGDELLEVNGIQLLGMNHVEVVSILKQLPNFVILVCARRSVPTRIINTAQCRDAFQARNILAGSLQTLIPNSEKLVKAKSDTSIASSSTGDTCCSDLGSRSRSLEAVTGLPLWCSEYTVVDLVKGDYGLGFSILDYQDPLDSEKTVIVIRSLVPGGVAQIDGRLIPGDRLIAVNDTTVDHGTLDKAVQVLKSSPKGVVKITVAKPLSANDNASYHSQDTDQEDQIYLDEFQECIEEYQECLEVVQICIDDDTGSFNHSNSTTQLEDMKNPPPQEDGNNWLNVSFDSDVCKMDDLKTVSESDVSFKSTCDRSDSAVESSDKADTKRGDDSVRLNTVCKKSDDTNKTEEASEKDGYETCMDESLSDEIKQVESGSVGDKTPTNSNLNLKLQEESTIAINPEDISITSTPETVLSINLNSSSEPVLNRKDYEKSNHICLDSKLDDSLDFYNNQTDDSLCGDEFFLVQCYQDDLSRLRPEVIKCSSEPNVLDTYEVCVPTVRYRRCIKEYYNDYEECLESYRIYTQQNGAKLSECAAMQEMSDDEIFNEILLPMRSKSAPNIMDNSFVMLTYDPGPDLSLRRKSAFVAGYPDDFNSESMTVTRTLDSSISGSKSSDFSTMLQKHWGSIRKVEINRQPNTSLGISIVGGKVDIHTPKTTPETILGIFIKNVVPDSPAGRTGKLNTGDRILEVSGVDLREVSHEKAVDIIRNAPNPVVFLIQSLIPWTVEDNHETIDNKYLSPIPSPEKIKPPEQFCGEPVIIPAKEVTQLPPDNKSSPAEPELKPEPEPEPDQPKSSETRALDVVPEIVSNSDKKLESILKSPTGEAADEIEIERTAIIEKPEKIDAPKVQIDLSPQVFGLAKEIKPAVKFEKVGESSSAIVEGEKPSRSTDSESDDSEEEEEDVRQLEGRTVSAKGHEIDRASAANVRRTKEEASADPDEEDDFGYTMNKVKKKYANLGHSILMVQLERSGQGLGLSLAGHKDRNCMAVFVCGINPTGAAYRTGGIQVGDEILEVNGVVLHGRCHLNASAIIKSLSGPIFKVIILRRKTAIDDIAVRPITQFPVSLAEESSEEYYNSYPNVRTITVRKGPQGLGIMIIEGKHADVGQGIFISDIQEGSTAEKAGLEIGEMILAVNKDPLLGSNYENAATLLKRTEGIVTLIVSNPTKKSSAPVPGEGDNSILVNDIGPSASAGHAVSNSLSVMPNNVSTAGSSAKPALKASATPSRPTTPVPEPPADPLTCSIIPGKDTQIEITTDNKILGLFFIGGKDTSTPEGIVVVEVYGGGTADKDGRLQPGDQILDVNGTALKDVTYTTASQALRQTLPKMKLTVYRPERIDFQLIETEIIKKPGKGLGLSVIARKDGRGVYISEILSGGAADVDGKITKGDLLVSVNGVSVESSTGEEAGIILKTAMGRVALKLHRYKATTR